MKHDVKNRLNKLEFVQRNHAVPELIFISKDESGYTIKEQYVKYGSNEKIIKGSGTEKIIKVENREDYVLPEGFKGVLLDGNIKE